MANAFEHENVIYGGFGAFEDVIDMSPEQWAEHDAQVSAEMAKWDEEHEDEAGWAEFWDDCGPD